MSTDEKNWVTYKGLPDLTDALNPSLGYKQELEIELPEGSTGIATAAVLNGLSLPKCLGTYEPETIPCATCGEPTAFHGTVRCDRCWEVEHRLEYYLEFEKGRKFVREALAKAEEETNNDAD